MGRKKIYANDSEKQKAYLCNKDKIPYRLVDGYVITNRDKYQPIMKKMNGDNNVKNNVNIVKPTLPRKSSLDTEDYKLFLQILDRIHINANKKQKKFLISKIGSCKTDDVRDWLIKMYEKKR